EQARHVCGNIIASEAGDSFEGFVHDGNLRPWAGERLRVGDQHDVVQALDGRAEDSQLLVLGPPRRRIAEVHRDASVSRGIRTNVEPAAERGKELLEGDVLALGDDTPVLSFEL